MKYNLKELQKALDTAIKDSGPTDIDVNIDPMDRLLISYTDTMGGDQVIITLFKSETNMMAKITRTERL